VKPSQGARTERIFNLSTLEIKNWIDNSNEQSETLPSKIKTNNGDITGVSVAEIGEVKVTKSVGRKDSTEITGKDLETGAKEKQDRR